jgi:ATP-dependent exoDNAse (exonuclease V) beta subunit
MRFKGQPPTLVVDRPTPLSPIARVCRYTNEQIQTLLPNDFRRMFARWPNQSVAEGLCVLYVAMTRAIHSLDMIVAPAKETERLHRKRSAACSARRWRRTSWQCRARFYLNTRTLRLRRRFSLSLWERAGVRAAERRIQIREKRLSKRCPASHPLTLPLSQREMEPSNPAPRRSTKNTSKSLCVLRPQNAGADWIIKLHPAWKEATPSSCETACGSNRAAA